jgi:hypothetical protein
VFHSVNDLITVWGSKSRPAALSSYLCCPFVLVDQATQDWSPRDPFVAEVRNGVGWLGWAKVAGAVGSSTVVVAKVFGEHCTEVPPVDDQHAVGEFGSQGADEPFGKAVRLWATWGNSDHVDAHIGENSVERGSELASPVAHEESELGDAIAQIHHEVAELLGGPSAVGMGGRAQQMYRSAGHLQDEQHIDPLKRHRGSPRGKSRRPTRSTPACAETAARSCRCPGPVLAVSATAATHGGSWTLPRDGRA